MRKNLTRTADFSRDAVQQLLHIEISTQNRKGLDFMKQTAIMLGKQVKLCSEYGFLATISFA